MQILSNKSARTNQPVLSDAEYRYPEDVGKIRGRLSQTGRKTTRTVSQIFSDLSLTGYVKTVSGVLSKK